MAFLRGILQLPKCLMYIHNDGEMLFASLELYLQQRAVCLHVSMGLFFSPKVLNVNSISVFRLRVLITQKVYDLFTMCNEMHTWIKNLESF